MSVFQNGQSLLVNLPPRLGREKRWCLIQNLVESLTLLLSQVQPLSHGRPAERTSPGTLQIEFTQPRPLPRIENLVQLLESCLSRLLLTTAQGGELFITLFRLEFKNLANIKPFHRRAQIPLQPVDNCLRLLLLVPAQPQIFLHLGQGHKVDQIGFRQWPHEGWHA